MMRWILVIVETILVASALWIGVAISYRIAYGHTTSVVKTYYKPNTGFRFVTTDYVEVGTLQWADGVVRFSGNAELAAQAFLEYFRQDVDSYIQAHIDSECASRVEGLLNELTRQKRGQRDA